MIVCVCNRVNCAQIKEAVRNGATDFQGISETLGVGTCCGSCVEFAEQMISEETRALSYDASIV